MKWNLVPLGTVCTVSSSKRIFAKEYRAEGIPFYRGKEVIEKHKGNPVSTELFISKERYEEIRSKYDVPRIGDILLTSVGTLGVPWLVDETDFYFKDGNLTWLRAKDGLLNKFLYLWLNSDDAKHQIDMMCIGSTQKALTIETINKFLIPLPSMKEQERICAIIFPIMERIKTNRSINDNLYDLLQSIYQLQFGVTSGNPAEGTLSDICRYTKDRIAVSELSLGNYYSTENMLPGKAGFTEATSLPTTPQTTRCNAGDVLVSNIRPYFKKIVLCHSEGGCSTDVLCFAPKAPAYSAYLFCTLYADRFFNFMVAGSKGTKMPRGDKQQIMTYPVYIPTESELTAFADFATPILSQIHGNNEENARLEHLRDTLLPKLMSGEIDVSAIDI